MNEILIFLLVWVGSGICAFFFFEITGINKLNGLKEHLMVFLISCLGGIITWFAPSVYGQEQHE